MNKVLKVIWSEARNAYVVVSEMAKNHGAKSCSTKKLLAMLIATGVMTCASMAPAMAADPPAEALKHSTVAAGYNITVTQKDNSDGGKEYNVDLKNDIYLAGDDPNALVSISGTNGTIEATGAIATKDRVYADKGAKLADIDVTGDKISNGASSIVLDGSNVKVNDKVTIDQNGNIAGVNSLQTNALNAKYNLSVGTANADGTVPFFVNSNGAFYAANGKLVVDKDGKLVAPEAELGNVVLKDGVFYKHTALRDGELFVGDASGNYSQITTKGAKLGKVTVAEDGKISGVAAGAVTADSTDAVNGSQLYATNQEVANNTNRINKLGSRVNKVGAGAAALAALHPMDFDPDDKLTFSAGYGNYAGENAAAIGAYYRPDEKVMFSVAGTVGNGENMVNAGVSFALDRTNHVSNSRTALAREVIDLRGQLAVMGAKMAKMEKAFGMLDETKTKLFPDVPANHWAYEYIAKLAGNGYIEGYPDGNFGGDRLMTRYEFAAMLYRAIENGAALEEKIIKEFEPELGRIRVDRISGEDGDRDKIERVRVNDTKGERDHYGNKLAK